MGFSDQYIAKLWKQDEVAVYNLRKEMNLFPVYKMIETSGCGGYIPYFYSVSYTHLMPTAIFAVTLAMG